MRVTASTTATNITMNTTGSKPRSEITQWWLAGTKEQRGKELISTVTYLKDNQTDRLRKAALFARLYGNQSLFNFAGSSIGKNDGGTGLPVDRPTFNLVQSAADTLISRITQSRPAPMFLTNNGDYKERNLAKKLNNFVLGEFYHTKAYDKAAIMMRDALVMGTGILKVYEDANGKVALDRVLHTELFVDLNESAFMDPRQLYQVKLVDRAVLRDNFKKTAMVDKAERATIDGSSESSRSVSDLVMVVEGWRLPSGKDATDGRHTIACSAGVLLDEQWDKDKFPFVFLQYSPRLLGFWAQGLAEQLMGTQLEINAMLYTITRAIKLVGVPRVFVEAGSKVSKASNNNDIGVIIEYRGTKPSYEVAPCVPQEMYAQLQRLIDYGYQQCGVSAMQASAQKPAGLNSGEAIRSYDDISTDRFAALSRKYDNVFIDLAYLVIDQAKDIAERDGKYSTVYPGKNGTKLIDFPKIEILKNPFIIQCFNTSSLPKDPAGRMQKITEMIQAGMISIKEGRRLLDYPDLEQVEKLANASEERIYQYLDAIVEDGDYTPPDVFMDLQLAEELVVQYINLYVGAQLEEEKAEMLRNFFSQVQALKQAAQPLAPPMGAAPTPGANPPQAQPEALPQSPLVPNANTGMAA